MYPTHARHVGTRARHLALTRVGWEIHAASRPADMSSPPLVTARAVSTGPREFRGANDYLLVMVTGLQERAARCDRRYRGLASDCRGSRRSAEYATVSKIGGDRGDDNPCFHRHQLDADERKTNPRVDDDPLVQYAIQYLDEVRTGAHSFDRHHHSPAGGRARDAPQQRAKSFLSGFEGSRTAQEQARCRTQNRRGRRAKDPAAVTTPTVSRSACQDAIAGGWLQRAPPVASSDFTSLGPSSSRSCRAFGAGSRNRWA